MKFRRSVWNTNEPRKELQPRQFFSHRGCIHALFFLLRTPQKQKSSTKAAPCHCRSVIPSGNKVQRRSKKKQQSTEIKQFILFHSSYLRFGFPTGYFGYGKRRGGCHFLCAQGRKAPARHAEGVRPQNLRGKIMKGGLPACPWRRKHKSRNAGRSKGRFRRKSVWRWRKSRTQDFFIIAGS